jgi:hypothetical protein
MPKSYRRWNPNSRTSSRFRNPPNNLPNHQTPAPQKPQSLRSGGWSTENSNAQRSLGEYAKRNYQSSSNETINQKQAAAQRKLDFMRKQKQNSNQSQR